MLPVYISIHTTLAGGDAGLYCSAHISRHISIHTTLAGGAVPADLTDGQYACISIHTTLAGGDKDAERRTKNHGRFQSTPPSRVATRESRTRELLFHISIHTTLAGGDATKSAT